MKYLIAIIISLITFTGWSQIDTIVVYDTIVPPLSISGEYYRTVHASSKHWAKFNSKKNDSLFSAGAEFTQFINEIYKYPINTEYYLKIFINDKTPLLEGKYINNINCGIYIEYGSNGNVITTGQFDRDYKINKKGKMKNKPNRIGEWLFYSPGGKLIRTIKY